MEAEPTLNSYPLKLDEFGLPWYKLNGLITNPRQIDLVIADRFEISLAYDFYFDSNNPNEKVTMPVYGYDRVEDRWMTFISGSTIEGRMPSEMYPEVFEYVFGDKNTAMKKGVAFIDREEFKNYRPPHYNGGIGQSDLVALIHDSLGLTKVDMDRFIQTGDITSLPMINGEYWLFPNQVDDRYQ